MSDSPAVVLHDLTLGVQDLTNQPGSSLPVQLSFQLESGGGVHFDGNLVVIPELDVKGEARLEAVFMPVAQPWLTQFANVTLESGLLDLEGDVMSTVVEPAAFGGSLNINDFRLVDTALEERLAGWTSLDINRAVQLCPKTARPL